MLLSLSATLILPLATKLHVEVKTVRRIEN